MSRLTRRLPTAWRQWWQHREFRIERPLWDARQLARIQDLRSAPDPARDASPDQAKELADAAVYLWRARQAVAKAAPEGDRRVRQVARYLRSCDAALAAAGLVVQDHDGAVYHPGQSLEVIEWRDVPELAAETVVSTVRPTVYFDGAWIRMGQVIVGRPTAAAATVPHPTNEGDRSE